MTVTFFYVFTFGTVVFGASTAFGDFVGVVKKADTGVLTPNADLPKIDELSCDVAPKAGAAALLLSKPVS